MAKLYGVTIPIAGHAYREIVADSEDDAIDAAMSEGFEFKDIEEWDAYRQLVRGNVVRVSVYQASAEDLGEAEDDQTPAA